MADQLWYTWTTKGLSGRAGEQVRAASPGVSDRSAPACGAALLVCRNPGADDAFGWIDSDAYRLCFRASSAVGLTADGRKGNFFVHVLVGEIDEMPLHLLAGLRDSDFWCTSDNPEHGLELQEVDMGQLVSRPDSAPMSSDRKEHFLGAALGHAQDYGSTIIDDGPEAAELAAVMEVLPGSVNRRGFRTPASGKLTQMFQVMAGPGSVPNAFRYHPEAQYDPDLLHCARLLLQEPQPETVANAASAARNLHEFSSKLRRGIAARTGALPARDCVDVVQVNQTSIDKFVADPEDLVVYVRALVTLDPIVLALLDKVVAAIGRERLAHTLVDHLPTGPAAFRLVQEVARIEPELGSQLTPELVVESRLRDTSASSEACYYVLCCHPAVQSARVEGHLQVLTEGLGPKTNSFLHDTSVDPRFRGRVAAVCDFSSHIRPNLLVKDRRFTEGFLADLPRWQERAYSQFVHEAPKALLELLADRASFVHPPTFGTSQTLRAVFNALPADRRWSYVVQYQYVLKEDGISLPVEDLLNAWIGGHSSRTHAYPRLGDLEDLVGHRISEAAHASFWRGAFSIDRSLRSRHPFDLDLAALLAESSDVEPATQPVLAQLFRTARTLNAEGQRAAVRAWLQAPPGQGGRLVVQISFLRTLVEEWNRHVMGQVELDRLAFEILDHILEDVCRFDDIWQSQELRELSALALQQIRSDAKHRDLNNRAISTSDRRSQKWLSAVRRLGRQRGRLHLRRGR